MEFLVIILHLLVFMGLFFFIFNDSPFAHEKKDAGDDDDMMMYMSLDDDDD